MLSLLNDDLRGRILVYFNGKILKNIEVLCKFPIDFLSNLSLILIKKTFSADDNLIVEKEKGDDIFFMIQGKVSIIHKKSRTHITELHSD